MATHTFLVFGDLHGRILPAFRLAIRWAADMETPLDGLLQVGDLGYFPDLTRLDKATLRHAKNDPTELGAQDIITPNELADGVFNDPMCPETMWFTAGNHEDHDALLNYARGSGRQPDCVVDAYGRVRCIKDGRSVPIAEGFSVGALWGVDDKASHHRTNLPPAGYISPKAANQLLIEPFQVLLTHDAPLDAKRIGYGSALIAELIHVMQPAFAFFGHYHGEGSRIEQHYGTTQVYHLSGLELGGRDGHAEYGSVGVLTWDTEEGGRFEFLDEQWLKSFTRHNWKWP